MKNFWDYTGLFEKDPVAAMRIPIREQLGLLVLLVSLFALMVLALAVVRLAHHEGEWTVADSIKWFQSHSFIIGVG